MRRLKGFCKWMYMPSIYLVPSDRLDMGLYPYQDMAGSKKTRKSGFLHVSIRDVSLSHTWQSQEVNGTRLMRSRINPKALAPLRFYSSTGARVIVLRVGARVAKQPLADKHSANVVEQQA